MGLDEVGELTGHPVQVIDRLAQRGVVAVVAVVASVARVAELANGAVQQWRERAAQLPRRRPGRSVLRRVIIRIT